MFLTKFYTVITWVLSPFLYGLMHLRSFYKKEMPDRIKERRGITQIARPKGKLIWIHAASNGEALSALPLIERLRALPSSPTILITTMTVTGAKLMEKRLAGDASCIHQFIPYDHPLWINRFHKHWTPDLVLWIESELWPNHLNAIKKRSIPAALLNARLSNKSVQRWKICPSWFQSMLESFSICLAQTERDKNNLQSLGIHHVDCQGNLKDMALPLPYDEYALEDMVLCTTNRTILLYASTHDGEEEIALKIYQKLKKSYPNLLSIIVPRHPHRAKQIVDICNKHNLSAACRSYKMSPRINTDIYIADTLGELGLFYTLCDIVFVGNSLHVKPGGGHNLLEPALLNCAILSGDDLHNFSVQAAEMPAQNACIVVSSEDSLLEKTQELLDDNEKTSTLKENALIYAQGKQSEGLDKIILSCESIFKNARLL